MRTLALLPALQGCRVRKEIGELEQVVNAVVAVAAFGHSQQAVEAQLIGLKAWHLLGAAALIKG